MSVNQDRVENAVACIAATVVANERYFCELDAVVGDGDFGFSVARGFEAVQAGWADYDRGDIGTFLQGVALTISRTMGGTSGPIWGTAFLRASVKAKGRSTLEVADIVAMLRSAAEGIMQRGRAELGDKTLLDALIPMTDAIENAPRATLPIAAAAARQAADATAPLQARRGRASYSGERSIGVPDAGAVAIAVLLQALQTQQDQQDQQSSTGVLVEGGSR